MTNDDVIREINDLRDHLAVLASTLIVNDSREAVMRLGERVNRMEQKMARLRDAVDLLLDEIDHHLYNQQDISRVQMLAADARKTIDQIW